ncbi:DMT family transporter [Ensifer sp. MJa1]|uniref:DMT family transporter n=1 Tax=Ensifer sp. MJa1 TaxID=2919888 RepID=UPI0030094F30
MSGAGSPHGARVAVIFAIGAATLAAADAVIVRALNGVVHPFVIGFFRAFFGAVILLPWVVLRPSVLRSSHPLRQHAVRAGFKLLAMVAFFAAFSWGPLADVTAIAFTSPIFVLLGAALTLGERPGPVMIGAVALGFAGAMLIVGPSGAGFSLAILLALIGAVLQSAIQLILKSMSKGDSTSTLVVWNLLLTVPIAFAFALPFWVTPGAKELSLLALQGVVGTACMGMMTHAFSLAPATIIAPVDFLRLPLVALGGFALFGENVALTTLCGGGLIGLAALIAARSGKATSG